MVTKPDATVAPAPGEPADSVTTSKGTVTEAEFLKVKESLSTALSASELKNTQLTEGLTTERAARQAVEAKVKGFEVQVTELTTLKPKYEALSAELQKINLAALEHRRTLLTSQYGVPLEKVKNLGADQLSILEDTLPTVAKPKIDARGLDGSSNGAPGPDSNMSASQRIAAALKNGK